MYFVFIYILLLNKHRVVFFNGKIMCTGGDDGGAVTVTSSQCLSNRVGCFSNSVSMCGNT